MLLDDPHPEHSKFKYQSYILQETILSNLLDFYDEFTYGINERLMGIYNKIFDRASWSFSNFEKVSFGNSTNLVDSINYMYKDLEYFCNVLEEKLSNTFAIDRAEIRIIIYGCNSKDYILQRKYIQEFYRIVYHYKSSCSVKNIGIVEYAESTWYLGRNLNRFQKAIVDSISKRAHYFNKDFSYLYDYYTKTSKTFDLLKTRFAIYEKLLEKYEDRRNFPLFFKEEDEKLFSEYDLNGKDDLKVALRIQLFEHISYSIYILNKYLSISENIKGLILKDVPIDESLIIEV